MKIFEFLTPPTWPKVQLIAIQRPKSLKDYFLESRVMAACKNSANSNGGFSRTRRGVFILNTYRSTPYLERRADGAPPPVLPETGCTSSGHLGGRRGHCHVFASDHLFFIYRRDTSYLVVADCFVCSEIVFVVLIFWSTATHHIAESLLSALSDVISRGRPCKI